MANKLDTPIGRYETKASAPKFYLGKYKNSQYNDLSKYIIAY